MINDESAPTPIPGGGGPRLALTALTVVMLTVVAMSSCSGSKGATPATSTDGGRTTTSAAATHTVAPTMAAAEYAWTSLDGSMRPFSDIAVAGDVGWLYVVEGGKLALAAIDGGGHLVFGPYEASKSEQAIGITVDVPLILEGRVFYYAPSVQGPEWHTLTWLDARTGEQGGAVELTAFRRLPVDCGDHRSVCFTAYDYDAEAWLAKRLDPATGALTVAPAPTDSDEPHTDVLIDREGSLELLVRQHASDASRTLTLQESGRTTWEHPLTDLFPADVDVSRGWHLEILQDSGLIVGWLGVTLTKVTDDEYIYPHQAPTVAISIENGELLWTAEGNNDSCDLGPLHLDIICEFEGPLTYTTELGWHVDPESNTLLTRVDLRDGTPIWTVDLGPVPGARTERSELPAQGRAVSEVLVDSPDGPLVVNLDTGISRPPAPDERFWCVHGVWDEQMVNGKDEGLGRGANLLFPCTATFAPADFDTITFAPEGVLLGTTQVIATPTGLIGFTRP